MKYLIISHLLLISLLYANDDAVLFNDTQELLQWHDNELSNSELSIESLPDATVVSIEEGEIYQDDVVIEEDTSYIDTLPFATVVEEEVVDDDMIEVVFIKDNKISIEDKNDTIVISAEVEEKNSTKPIVITNHYGVDTQTSKLNESVAINEKIDFWKLLDLTLINATALILKKHDIKITQENMELVKSEYYPNLSIGYTGEYYHGYDRGSSATIGGSFYPGITEFRDSISLSMNYEIYRFGATDLKVKMSEKDVEIVKSELALQEEDISKQLLSYYAGALRAQNIIKYKDKIKLVQSGIIEKKLRLFEAGQIAKMEISKDQLAFATLEKEISNQKLNFLKAVKDIQVLSNITLDSSIVKFAMLEPKNSTIKTFKESAIAKNLNLNLEKKLQELELIKKDYKPTLYASSGYRLYGGAGDYFSAIENIERNSWDVGITLKWDIFNGYKTDKTVERIKLEVNKLVEQYRLAKIDFKAKEMKRELLKESISKILKIEAQILDQTSQQEEMLVRLVDVGQISSLQLGQIEISKIQSELSFRLGVLDQVYESISSELII